MPFRRKLGGRTNYRTRMRLLSSGEFRIVVRKSLKNITASLVKYSPGGDIVAVTASSRHLAKIGWKADRGNVPAAYLVGCILARKAEEKGIKKAILDLGLNKSIKGSRIYAVVAGAVDAGLDIPHDKGVLPPKDRITGKHIEDYCDKIKKNKDAYEKQFSAYIKNNIDPSSITKHFEEVKSKIIK